MLPSPSSSPPQFHRDVFIDLTNDCEPEFVKPAPVKNAWSYLLTPTKEPDIRAKRPAPDHGSPNKRVKLSSPKTSEEEYAVNADDENRIRAQALVRGRRNRWLDTFRTPLAGAVGCYRA